MRAKLPVIATSCAVLFLFAAALSAKAQVYSLLHTFARGGYQLPAFVLTNSDGVNPSGGVVLSGQIMYGTANSGGTNGSGTVFAITNGAFNLLRTFTALNLNTLTNADGANPNGGLILSGGTLYGTASAGGAGGNGTVFSINTNGTGFNRLYSFTAVNPTTLANPDGANPSAGLILAGITLYGTANNGGSSDNGTVFAVNTNGTGFATLHGFTARSGSSPYTNSDGAYPRAGLILSGKPCMGRRFKAAVRAMARCSSWRRLPQSSRPNFPPAISSSVSRPSPGPAIPSSRTPIWPEPIGLPSPTSSAVAR